MSIIWLEGFETYGYTEGDDLESEMLQRGYVVADAQIGLTSYFKLTDGRLFGKALTFYDTSTITERLNIDILGDLLENNTIGVGFALKHTGLEYNQQEMPINNFRSGDPRQLGLFLNPLGALNFRQSSSGTILGTIPDISPGVWHYIEFQIVCDDINGEILAKLNGQEVFHHTDLDTQGVYFNNNLTNLEFYGINGVSLDDLYVTTGELLGPIVIENLKPSADGSTTEWSVSTGTEHYAVIDDQPLSTDHVYSDTVGEEDQLALENLQHIDSSIKVVTPVAAVALSEAGTRTFNLGLKLTSVSQSSTEVTSTDYVWDDNQFHTQNFDTSTDWDVSSVNSLELNLSSQ